MRAIDVYNADNIAATTAAFPLAGGAYWFEVAATFGGGTVKLQKLGPDDVTWFDVGTTTTLTAAGGASVALPQGSYRVNIATATAVYASVVRIPGE